MITNTLVTNGEVDMETYNEGRDMRKECDIRDTNKINTKKREKRDSQTNTCRVFFGRRQKISFTIMKVKYY